MWKKCWFDLNNNKTKNANENKNKQFMRALLEDRGDKRVRNKMCDEN